MGLHQGPLRWVRRPQAVVCFVVLCLCVAAFGGMTRSVSSIVRESFYSHYLINDPQVKGAAVERLARPDCSKKPCIALTFDDGPHDRVTPHILDTLARHDVKATFFLVGSHIAGREELVRREHREGHEIGNHSWSHPDLTKLAPADALSEIARTQTAIAQTGVPAPRLMRPPYGAIDEMVAGHTRLTIIRWNVDPADWKTKDPAKLHEQILTQARSGAIILLHDKPATAAALDGVIASLKPVYQFVTVSQLLDLSMGDQGQFFGGR